MAASIGKYLGNIGYQSMLFLTAYLFVDYNEFIVASFNRKALLNRENLTKVFNIVDTNGDEEVDLNEFMIAFPTSNFAGYQSNNSLLYVVSSENQRW